MQASTAIAHPNIALIKYWGNLDPILRIPSTGSISMNLDGLYTHTRVMFDSSLEHDTLISTEHWPGKLLRSEQACC